MDTKELRQKTVSELDALLEQYRTKLYEGYKKAASREKGNVREVRDARKTVAKILTLIREKK